MMNEKTETFDEKSLKQENLEDNKNQDGFFSMMRKLKSVVKDYLLFYCDHPKKQDLAMLIQDFLEQTENEVRQQLDRSKQARLDYARLLDSLEKSADG